jgi:hypothetical protein
VRVVTLRNIAWGSIVFGAAAIVVAFAVEFGIGFSFWDVLFAAWQTTPVILAALLLRERVMHPLTALVATVASVSLTLLEILTIDLTSSSTAAIAILFFWVYPVILVSLCLLAQVAGVIVVSRRRRTSG